MGIETGLKVGINALTQVAKKAYVKPMSEVYTLESLRLKIKPLTGAKDLTEINPAQKIKSLQARLEGVLRSPHCEMPNYMKLIPEGASQEETIAYLQKMFQESKFFSRVSTCEMAYGKNFEFARMMNELSGKTSESISKGKSFKDILTQIAKGYSEETKINTKLTNKIGKSGMYRGSYTEPHHYIEGVGRVDSYTTNYFSLSGDGYVEYIKRFEGPLQRTSPYKDFTLTEIQHSDRLMHHPYHEQVARNMDIISERYKIFQDLVKAYNKTGKLTVEQRVQADDIISEIYYLMANTCPFKRGSNGISDVLMRSQYSALGINMPHVKSGVGLDLEAFCFELGDYKKNWRAFFVGGGTIKPVIYKSKNISTLIKLDEGSLNRAKELVRGGLMSKEFALKVENATSIEECETLLKQATTKWEKLYASLRIPEQ